MFSLAMSALIYFGLSLCLFFLVQRMAGRRWKRHRLSPKVFFKEKRESAVASLIPALLIPVLIIASVLGLTEDKFSFEAQMGLYVFLFSILAAILFYLATSKGSRRRW
jgi:hypothetical protein